MNKTQLARLESFVHGCAENFFAQQGFTKLFPPKIVRASGACENVNTLFEVVADKDPKWFGRSAYLSQTGQLYLEAFVPSLEKVYCLGPSFRAEGKVDIRHLTEFTMLEIEFAGDFEKLLHHIETLLYHVAQETAKLPAAESKYGLTAESIKRLKSCPKKFSRLSYDQAIESLKAMGEDIAWGDDISSARERMLLQSINNQPLFITHHPDPMFDHKKEIEVEKFFNMLPDPQLPGRVQSCDTILPFGGETVGSAARVHELKELIDRLKNSRMYQRLRQLGGDLSDFEWYINQIKKHGAVPHAGCGFGMSRIMQWIIGQPDITQAITFPSNRQRII